MVQWEAFPGNWGGREGQVHPPSDTIQAEVCAGSGHGCHSTFEISQGHLFWRCQQPRQSLTAPWDSAGISSAGWGDRSLQKASRLTGSQGWAPETRPGRSRRHTFPMLPSDISNSPHWNRLGLHHHVMVLTEPRYRGGNSLIQHEGKTGFLHVLS